MIDSQLILIGKENFTQNRTICFMWTGCLLYCDLKQ